MSDLVRAGAIGVATAVVGVVLALSTLGASFEERFGLTWLFAARGPVATPGDVTVVGLDRRSAERMDLPEKIRDWPRGLYAELITDASADGASVIALDLILERAREPDHDAALARAIDSSKRVVLFEALDLKREPVGNGEHAPLGLIETQRLRPPIDAFAEAAAGLASFPLPIVPDRVNQVWLFKPGAGGRPTLPAVALQRHALSVFPTWRSLLREAGTEGLDGLPEDVDALADANDLRALMLQLRQAFQADGDLAKRLRAAVRDKDIDAETRRLLLAQVTLYDGPDSRFLNFYGPAGKITTHSLVDALDSAGGSENRWNRRAVFVGQSELFEPHNDAFITVYSRPDGVMISGVEIAATAFANLLDGRLLEPSRFWLIAIAAFGLVIGMVAGLLPALWAVAACLVIAALYFMGAGLAFARGAIWLPTTVPLLAELPLGLFLGLFLQYRRARRARENLSKAIRYYLPKRIAEGFADAPVAPLLKDEEAYAICLITDASGFTPLAETMPSKRLKPFLEDYLGILFTAVETNGGRVTDSVGDGVTAAWTSPTPDPAVAAKACQAALAIDRDVQRFNIGHEHFRLPTRIGLSAGPVTLGHVGGAGRFTYTVIGDAVNTASRIEQLNKRLGTRILATRAVVERVPGMTIRPLGKFQLFGKEEVLEMVEVRSVVDEIRQLGLNADFAEALDMFQQEDWEVAAQHFAEIVLKYEDEAARFYLETCRLYLDGSSTPSTAIHLQTK